LSAVIEGVKELQMNQGAWCRYHFQNAAEIFHVSAADERRVGSASKPFNGKGKNSPD